MSILKFSCGPSAQAGLKYYGLEQDREGNEKCVAWADSLGLEGKEQIAKAWEMTRREFQNEGGREYYHVSYNLDPSDTNARQVSNEKLLTMGAELAGKMAPGHDYACFVHRDKEHPHVHVVWNTVHSETGRKYQQGPKDLERAFQIKDEMDRTHGFKVTERRVQRDRIPDEAQRIYARDSRAYLWTEDLKHRITLSREEAQSFQGFREQLKERGVMITERGRDNKLTYRFTDETGKQRAIRERRLGDDYSRARIERGLSQAREPGISHSEGARGSGYGHGTQRGQAGDQGTSRDDGGRQHEASRGAERGFVSGHTSGGSTTREPHRNESLSQLGEGLIQRYGADRQDLSRQGGAALAEARSRVGATSKTREVEEVGDRSHRRDHILYQRMGWLNLAGAAESHEGQQRRGIREVSGDSLSQGQDHLLGAISRRAERERQEKIEEWRAEYGHSHKTRGTQPGRPLGAKSHEPGRSRGFCERYEQELVSAFGKLRGGAQTGLGATKEKFDRDISSGSSRFQKSAFEFGEKLGEWHRHEEKEQREINEAHERMREAFERKRGRPMRTWELRELEIGHKQRDHGMER